MRFSPNGSAKSEKLSHIMRAFKRSQKAHVAANQHRATDCLKRRT